MKSAALSEQHIQQQIVDYLGWALADNALAFHVPMGGSRNALEAKKLKRMGSRAGIPDLVVLHRGRAFFIELKADKGRLSVSQKHMIARIESAECPVGTCRSLEDVVEFLSVHCIPLRSESITTERIRRGFENAMAEGGE